MDCDRLAADLRRDEGVVLKVYRDSVGVATIGVGRNLESRGISAAEADLLLSNDVDRVENECRTAFVWWPSLNDTRQRVIANMCFNLGLEGLKKFHDTLAAVAAGDYAKAAACGRASHWASQVGHRAVRLMLALDLGHD